MESLLHDGRCGPLNNLEDIPEARRLDVMAYLANHLVLIETGEHPEHSCWSEAVIHDIFMVAARNWHREARANKSALQLARLQYISMFDDFDSAVEHIDEYGDDRMFLFTGEKVSVEEWEGLAEDLADGILWDRDFEMTDLANLPAAAYSSLDKQMGIGADYFSTPIPDYTQEDRDRVFAQLKSPAVLERAKPDEELLALDRKLMEHYGSK